MSFLRKRASILNLRCISGRRKDCRSSGDSRGLDELDSAPSGLIIARDKAILDRVSIHIDQPLKERPAHRRARRIRFDVTMLPSHQLFMGGAGLPVADRTMLDGDIGHFDFVVGAHERSAHRQR